MLFLIYPIILISGFTGLVYQLTWQKYLSIYLGSHALSTSLTLSCFFLFLSLGYYTLGKNGHLLGKNRLMTYAYIEALIGLFAIVSPALFAWAYDIWPSFPSNTWQHILSSFGFALVMMAFPTFLMGGTIPILTQGLSHRWKESHKVHAWVYGINTFGAFAGSLFSGFYLIEKMGLAQTLNVTGVLNCLIFIIILFAVKITGSTYSGATPIKEKVSGGNYNKSLLTIAFLSGFISFGVESLCIRIAGLSLGSSNYTYCIVVSAFICAIAVGSMLASRLSERKGFYWLLSSHAGILLSLIALYFLFPKWPDLFLRLRMIIASSTINFPIFWGFIFIVISIILAIPVILMGTTLPLLFQKMRSESQFLNKTAGAMYAVNSLGASLGAVLAGYLLFFFLRLDQIFLLLIFMCLLAIGILIFNSEKKNKVAIGVLSALFLALFAFPRWQDSSFVPSRFIHKYPVANHKDLQDRYEGLNNRGEHQSKFLFSDFGVNTYTVITESTVGDRTLYVNAKADADTSGDMFTRLLNALVPLTLAKKMDSVFIIGLGTGLSTGAAAAFSEVQSVKVSEIANGAIKAMPFFSKWNFDIEKNKDKVTITNDDAYKVLQYQKNKFDLIFSEPSNTWVTGVEKLYTSEFLKVAANRLSDDGIYSQWFPLFSMTEESFLSVLKNFKGAFPFVTLWTTGGNASLILASHKPLNVDLDIIRDKNKKYRNLYKTAKVEDATNLLYYQVWSDSVITDLVKHSHLEHSLVYPSLAFQSARAFFVDGRVNLEKFSTKYFMNNEKEYEDSPLLWQLVMNKLDKKFFSDGTDFYLNKTSYSFAAGRITLAHAKLFDDWKKKKSKDKIAQYLYLQDPGKTQVPAQTTKAEEEGHILAELFTRFQALKKMRESAYLSQVLKAAPDKCDNDICYTSKISILFFDKKITSEDAKSLNKQIKEEATKQRVDKMFKDLVAKSSNS